MSKPTCSGAAYAGFNGASMCPVQWDFLPGGLHPVCSVAFTTFGFGSNNYAECRSGVLSFETAPVTGYQRDCAGSVNNFGGTIFQPDYKAVCTIPWTSEVVVPPSGGDPEYVLGEIPSADLALLLNAAMVTVVIAFGIRILLENLWS